MRPDMTSHRIFSLQTRLVVSITALILASVVLTGVVFVLRSREDSQRQALERVAASAPGFFHALAPTDITAPAALPVEGSPEFSTQFTQGTLATLIDRRAADRDLRVLLVGGEGEVLHDSRGGLEGTVVSFPVPNPADVQRGYVAWQPGASAADFTFVASAGEQVDAQPSGPIPFVVPIRTDAGWERYGMVLGVETAKIENAWLDALPGVGIAAGLVAPFAVLLAIVLSRQIARPIHQLTAASEAMALGNFDQRVEVKRSDEVGRLASAFTTMAERVGERDAQMRALLANVSHDLKTPMTSIIGYAQAVRDGVADDPQAAAKVIHGQATVAHALLADLLFLSEIDSGQAVCSRETASAAFLLETAITRTQPQAEARDIVFATVVEDGLVCREIDPPRLIRALTNLTNNAVKFSPQRGTVRLSAVKDKDAIRFEVENSGSSISDDDLLHIFDRFYRGQEEASGHGLGLAIAREAVELHGGSIEALNLASGVKLSIYIPIA